MHDIATLRGRALAHAKAGRMEEALVLFLAVARLAPDSADAASDCAKAHVNLYRNREGRDWFARAAALDPASERTAHHYGTVCHLLGELDEALAAFDRALALRPDWTDAILAKANVHRAAGRMSEAEAGFHRTLELDPGDVRATINLGLLRAEQARHADSLSLLGKAQSEQNWLFVLNYAPGVPAELAADAYRAWGRRHAEPLRAFWPRHPAVRAAKERLRVGVVSCDFRNHSMRHFLLPALANLDPARIDLTLYSATLKEDAFTARYRAIAGRYSCIEYDDDAAAAARIAADGIDILLDVSGHTAGNRLTLFARKPAPVQATWLGYGTTTGIAAIDWFLGDSRLAPPGSERCFVERVWRLPTAYCYAPPEEAPAVAPLPARSAGAITFGCFSRTIRFGDPTLAAWGEILKRLPHSRLRLDSLPFADAATRADFAARLVRFGARDGQIAIAHTTPQPRVWEAYGEIDIALDPFPHNAGATTFEALWQGVPVLSRRDRVPVGRFGDSILGAAGLGDWVVDTVDQYVETAVARAGDLAALAALRAGLRERLQASGLTDAARFGRHLTDALHGMWSSPASGIP
ncbi:MAG: glycosyltransferase [Proteobacteria bacterium]|nr:glycosyltransferase [Pseudomonadota bacterium]